MFYFQHYYQYKKSLWSEEQEFPWQIDHLVRDTITAVRPKLQIANSLEDARKAVQALNKQIVTKAIEVILWIYVNLQILSSLSTKNIFMKKIML